MREISGQLTSVGRIGIAVSRYHERITSRLLEGALRTVAEAGHSDEAVDIVWVPGAFELGVMVSAMAATGRYAVLIALGVVIRGETPHFDYVAGEASRAIGSVASEQGLPVGFGLLTTDSVEQAMERAGGRAGNKGAEAAEAAIRTADAIRQVRAS